MTLLILKRSLESHHMAKVSLDNVFLGLLTHESSHGYQLRDHFREQNCLATVWNLSTSRLYSTLKQLENAQLISGHEEHSVDAPTRIVYTITDKGLQQFEQWLNHPQPSASTRAIRTEFLSRLYICQLLKRPIESIIDAQALACKIYREQLITQRDQLEACVGYLSLDLRAREMTLILDWIHQAETMFTPDKKVTNQ